tara:strand:- start:14453 stop:14710 length:258 start_codon:yes stop_codon:yes gene_type:complete
MGEFIKRNFEEAVVLFNEKTPKNYDKEPSIDYSSARMGGWLMKDKQDMNIGWVGHRGDVQVYDYKDREVGQVDGVRKKTPYGRHK